MQWWRDAFAKLEASPDFERYMVERDVLPMYVSGDELQALVKKQVAEYRELGREFGLVE